MESSYFYQLDKGLRRWPIALLGLLIGAILMGFWNFKWRFEHLNAQRQKARVESLAYQVLEIRRQSLKSDRGPASEAHFEGNGRVGLDPDGKPYFYQLAEEDSSWVVRIWSEKELDGRTEVRIRKDQL